MGWSQGPSTWTEMERVLDGRRNPHAPPGDGGDGPAWSRRRQPYEPPPQERGRSVVPYAELHAHSAFSFLDGASLPEEMAQEAARLGLKALAITDHNGFYGVVRFAEAAKELGLPTVFGAELSLGGQGNTEESVHLLVLARGQEGYRRLSRQMSAAHLSGGTPKDRKGKPRFDLDVLTEAAGGTGIS
ncbi:PHP domain protein [Mycobacteroides abscessus subsp. bolletii 1513]|uniref:PHP domain protein n=1 Tax=Mycobacteroides abscessus subsp. bolletii 1513 TaxID=1299321 RepID=X8DFL4_9MYCO|nr:PHP domain protein [Mycobacteroides abscessus subsp. bolletii 1513]